MDSGRHQDSGLPQKDHGGLKMPDKRIELAKIKLEELQSKLEKVKGTPREEEFQLQIDKLQQLIEHLENE